MRTLALLLVMVALAVAIPPSATATAALQQKKTAVKKRTKGNNRKVTPTKNSARTETPVDVQTNPILHVGDVNPDAVGGQCMACIHNPGVCASCNGSGKMRKVSVETGTQYLPCDKCGGTKICSMCHGKSAPPQPAASQPLVLPPDGGTAEVASAWPTPAAQPGGYSRSTQPVAEPVTYSNAAWKDHTTRGSVQDLMRYMQSKSGAGGIIIMPRRASMEHNHNGVFLYFVQPESGPPRELRLRVQYYADAPQNFCDLEFDVSNRSFTYHAGNPQRGRSGRYYWEYNDQPVTMADRELLNAIENCDWIQVYYLGASANAIKHRKTLTDDDLRDFERVITLYRLSGGNL